MNRSDIRTHMRDLLDESTEGFWSNDDLNRYINLANRKVNSVVSLLHEEYFTVSSTFSTVSGTKSYSLPTDCRLVRRLEIYNSSDASDIIKVDELRFPRIEAGGEWPFSSSGQPQRYIVRATQFDLLPTPDAVYTMRIYYDARKSDLATDSDTPQAPSEFHDMLVYWACALAQIKNKEKYDEFAEMYKVRERDLIQSLERRGSDDPDFVESYLEGIY